MFTDIYSIAIYAVCRVAIQQTYGLKSEYIGVREPFGLGSAVTFLLGNDFNQMSTILVSNETSVVIPKILILKNSLIQ